MKRIEFLIVIFLLLNPLFASGQVALFQKDILPEAVPENLDIYLVIGQSNMAGRAMIRAQDELSLDNVYLFTGDLRNPWVVATNPINRHSTVRKNMDMQRLGPAYSFAKTMVEARPERQIGLVANARGGTKIVQWMPGTELYQEAVKQVHKALKYGRLKGVIWHQGEGDCQPVRVELYFGRLEILINAIREEFDDPAIPFVAGQLFDNEVRHSFNEMIWELPDLINYTGVASSEGTQVFDGTHFNSESAFLLGQRYAAEMLRLQEESDTFNKKRKK